MLWKFFCNVVLLVMLVMLWEFFCKIFDPMSSSQTEFVEQSDSNLECNVDDTLAQTPPKKKIKAAKRYCVFPSEWLKKKACHGYLKLMILLHTALSAGNPFLLNMSVNPQFLAMLNQKNIKRPSLRRNKIKLCLHFSLRLTVKKNIL